MANWKKLKIGDKLRLLKVPEADLRQREREIAAGLKDAGWTANTIELIIAQSPVVKIDDIDAFGSPWYTTKLMVDGKEERHLIAISEDESWELIE